MTIELNKVTWYSKLAAVVLFIVVLILGMYIGAQYEHYVLESKSLPMENGSN